MDGGEPRELVLRGRMYVAKCGRLCGRARRMESGAGTEISGRKKDKQQSRLELKHHQFSYIRSKVTDLT